MNDVLYRVDSGLKTLVEVPRSKLDGAAPLNCWIPVMIGDGEYCYFTDEADAKKALKEIIQAEIDALQELANSI